MTWTQRLKRVFCIDVESCPACGGAVRSRLRGVAIHRMLQLATEAQQHEGILQRVAAQLRWTSTDETLRGWWQEVQRLLHEKTLGWLFQPGAETRVFNEVPIQYRHNGQMVYGIIDRLLVTETEAHLVDYKSHRVRDEQQLTQLAEHYRPQMALYREGVQRLWPDIRLNTYVLVTDSGRLFPMQ